MPRLLSPKDTMSLGQATAGAEKAARSRLSRKCTVNVANAPQPV